MLNFQYFTAFLFASELFSQPIVSSFPFANPIKYIYIVVSSTLKARRGKNYNILKYKYILLNKRPDHGFKSWSNEIIVFIHGLSTWTFHYNSNDRMKDLPSTRHCTPVTPTKIHFFEEHFATRFVFAFRINNILFYFVLRSVDSNTQK